MREILFHKSANNTLLYNKLVNFKDDEFTAGDARSEQEVCQLVEEGFDFVCDLGRNKLFRRGK